MGESDRAQRGECVLTSRLRKESEDYEDAVQSVFTRNISAKSHMSTTMQIFFLIVPFCCGLQIFNSCTDFSDNGHSAPGCPGDMTNKKDSI